MYIEHPCTRCCRNCCMFLISFKPYNYSYEVNAIFIPMLQIMKLRLRGVMTPGWIERHGGVERGRRDMGQGLC